LNRPNLHRLARVGAPKCSESDHLGAGRNRATNADETDERGVVAEINFCRDLIEDAPKAGAK
jgi:hypothetical protein